MCISPTLIKNPNYGATGYLSKVKDTHSQYIKVPCGVCPQCIASKQMKLIQRCQMMCFDYHPFYGTLTYNQESLPIWTFSNGVEVPFADFRDVTLMFKRIRKNNLFERSFKYMVCSEFGGKKKRPHFHFLLFVRKSSQDDFNTCITLEKRLFDLILLEWRRNYGSTRNPDYRPLCTFYRKFVHGRWSYNYDLQYVFRNSSRMVDDVSYYICKYMLKPSGYLQRLQQAMHLNLSPEEYRDSWLRIRSRCVWSKGFGCPKSRDVAGYIRKCIDLSLLHGSEFPMYFDNSGKSMPLSNYYKRFANLFPSEVALAFHDRHVIKSGCDDGYYESKPLSIDQINSLESKFEKNVDFVEKSREEFLDFSDF